MFTKLHTVMCICWITCTCPNVCEKKIPEGVVPDRLLCWLSLPSPSPNTRRGSERLFLMHASCRWGRTPREVRSVLSGFLAWGRGSHADEGNFLFAGRCQEEGLFFPSRRLKGWLWSKSPSARSSALFGMQRISFMDFIAQKGNEKQEKTLVWRWNP